MLEYPHIDPVIFTVGPFQLRWYSLMYVLGFTAAYVFFRRSVTRGTLKMTLPQVESSMIWGMLGMLFGARFVYVFVYNYEHFLANPSEILAFWHGGLAFHGGFVGLIAALLVFATREKIDYLNMTDHASLIVPLGLGLGRIGNFVNGELWGRVTDVPWAMVFPTGGPMPRHPSQLYQAFGEGLVLLLIVWMTWSRRPPIGVVSGMFIAGYGVIRFFGEFFREPDAQLGFVLGPFSMGQVLSMLMWVFGGVIIAIAKSQNRKQYSH